MPSKETQKRALICNCMVPMEPIQPPIEHAEDCPCAAGEIQYRSRIIGRPHASDECWTTDQPEKVTVQLDRALAEQWLRKEPMNVPPIGSAAAKIDQAIRAALADPQETTGGERKVEPGCVVDVPSVLVGEDRDIPLRFLVSEVKDGRAFAADTEGSAYVRDCIVVMTRDEYAAEIVADENRANPSKGVVVTEEMKALARFFAAAVDADFPEGQGLDSDGTPTTEAADIADQLAKGDRAGALSLLADPGISEDHDGLRAALGVGLQDSERQTAAEMLAEFHRLFAHPTTDALWLRPTLHREEHQELLEALEDAERLTGIGALAEALPQVARELADVVYVAYGTALLYGIDLDAALRAVHKANLSKLGEDGQPIRREDGKVLKGPNFQPPDMSAALATTPSPEEAGDA